MGGSFLASLLAFCMLWSAAHPGEDHGEGIQQFKFTALALARPVDQRRLGSAPIDVAFVVDHLSVVICSSSRASAF